LQSLRRENYLALVEQRQMSAGNDVKERRNMWTFLRWFVTSDRRTERNR